MLGASSCLQIRNGLISGQGTILVSAGTPSGAVPPAVGAI